MFGKSSLFHQKATGNTVLRRLRSSRAEKLTPLAYARTKNALLTKREIMKCSRCGEHELATVARPEMLPLPRRRRKPSS